MTRMTTLEVLQRHVGPCREELGSPTYEKCNAPAEYVLWGKLIPSEALGPRCYKHAQEHLDDHALRSRSNFALIHLVDLAADLGDRAA